MRKIVLSLVSLPLLLLSCSSGEKQNEQVMKYAKQYYDYLLEGKYEQFVDGSVANRDIPTRYKEQLVANAKMFVKEQQDSHRGILNVRATGADVDEQSRTANVFLILCFGDSTNEEILVQMVEHDGTWMMR